MESFEKIVIANVWSAIDQRHDTKNYDGFTHVCASYLQNAIDTCREYKINVSAEAVYGAFARELDIAFRQDHRLAKEYGRVPDGFRI